jgi:hypothetical protein
VEPGRTDGYVNEPRTLTVPQRAAIAAVVGLAIAGLTYRVYGLAPPMASDFDFVWIGIHALVHGQNPYQAVAAANVHGFLYYPMPALIVTAPLGLVSAGLARIIFAAVGMAALAYAAAGRRGALLVGVFSASALVGAIGGQWSPLLTAGAAVPWLSALWITKPSIGLALMVGYPTRECIYGGVVLLAMSFIFLPTWVGDWAANLGTPQYLPPLRRPGGFLLLLALLRWRRPEGRMLAALTVIPHVTTLYETVPLFLIPATRLQGYILLVLTFVAAALEAWVVPDGNLVQQVTGRWPVLFVLVYVPALVMLLWLPNEGTAPEWLRDLAGRLHHRTREPDPQ